MLALVGFLALAAFGAAPASAHSDLVSSNPADGAALQAAPAEVVLTFNENIGEAGLQVVAQGADGTVDLGTPVVDGPNVTTPWPADAAGGDYRLSFRVVSADGHPIDGTIAFSYPAESGAAAAAVLASASPEAVADVESTSAATAESGDSFPLWVPVVVIIVGVAIGATIARALRRRGSGTPAA